MKLLIIGNTGGTNIGGSLLEAASELGWKVELLEARLAMEAPVWVRRFNWWLRGRRPSRLGQFSRLVVEKASFFRPVCLLTTGFAPCCRSALKMIGEMGIERFNYLTDDPFNSIHRAPWFLEALPLYDHVFSPRRANLQDLLNLGCRQVSYLPFAYDPNLQHAVSSSVSSVSEKPGRWTADVVFAGGADRDRVPYLDALIKAGFSVALYGDYWDRFPETCAHTHGHADPFTLYKAIAGAKVALCLVRRANRDGHVMRTFEVPAMGTCMLTEDTEEHREIFGEDGQAVVYFRTKSDMVKKLQWLLDHDDERKRLAAAAHTLITTGRNTYKDRLLQMLQCHETGKLKG